MEDTTQELLNRLADNSRMLETIYPCVNDEKAKDLIMLILIRNASVIDKALSDNHQSPINQSTSQLITKHELQSHIPRSVDRRNRFDYRCGCTSHCRLTNHSIMTKYEHLTQQHSNIVEIPTIASPGKSETSQYKAAVLMAKKTDWRSRMPQRDKWSKKGRQDFLKMKREADGKFKNQTIVHILT